MSNQGYYGNQPQPQYGAPQYPQQSYGNQPQYYQQGPPPQMQYQQGYAPPQQKQSKQRGCLGACLATLCCCFLCEEGCECCADCAECCMDC